ncbi:MAG TPA: hypothetical protein PLF40_21285, partial [Kofleriaceae bacterium]|nr:hypothetical protein [Kofleriaceae bacterium]
AHLDHAQQQQRLSDAQHAPNAPHSPSTNTTDRYARPQYKPSIAQANYSTEPVAALHGPAATHAVAVVVPADFERFNPKLGVNQLRSVIEPAQVAAINAACAAKDLPRARQLLREAFGSIAERVNTVGDAVALGHIKEAGRASDALAATRRYFAAAQRLRELAKAQGTQASAGVASSVSQPLMLGFADDAQRGISRAPAGRAAGANVPSAADVGGPIVAAVPYASPAPSAVPPAALPANPPTKQSLVAAAKAVEERAQYVHVVFASSSQPLDESVARLNAAMDGLANVAQEHGSRTKAENAVLQAAWRAALNVANDLATRRPGGRLENSIRQRISSVEAVLQEVTAGAQAGVAPSTLATTAQQSVELLERTVIVVASLQASFALQTMFAQQAGFTQLSTEALSAEITTTTAWIEELKGPHGKAAAPRLTVAIEAQAATLAAATAELGEVLNAPMTATTGVIVAAYVKVIAAAGHRRGTVAPLLARARQLRHRQPLDAVNAALSADAAQVDDIAKQSVAGGRAANAKLRGLAAREAALEAQIAEGKQVAPQVVDQLAADVRESEFLHRVASLRMQAGQLSHAMHEMDKGVKSVVLSGKHGRLADELALLAGDMRSIAHQYNTQRDAVGPAADPATKLRGQQAALRAMEATLQARLRAGKFEQTLTAAAKQMKDSGTRLFAFQLVTMIVVTLAGQWGAAAIEGATSAAMLASAEVVAYTEEGAAIYSLGTLASVGRASWTAGRIADMAINVGAQKVLGDHGRISTLIVVNVLTPVMISALMKPFSNLGALRGLSEAEALIANAGAAAPTIMSRAAGALRGAGSLTVTMVSGAAIDYATRMAMEHRAASPTDQTVTEWFLQGAAMAIGAHLTTHVPALSSRLAALRRGRNGTADLDALAARATALQHATAELSHATPEQANATLGEYAKLLEATNALTPKADSQASKTHHDAADSPHGKAKADGHATKAKPVDEHVAKVEPGNHHAANPKPEGHERVGAASQPRTEPAGAMKAKGARDAETAADVAKTQTMIEGLASSKALPEQHAHEQGTIPIESVLEAINERRGLTSAERAQQIDLLKQLIATGTGKGARTMKVKDLSPGGR